MSAKDYEFVASCLGNLYLAKKTKSKRMSKDRRLVDDNEIISLFEHYLRRRCEELEDDVVVVTKGEKKIFEAKLLDKEQIDEAE